MTIIEEATVRKILDSRGEATVEVEISTAIATGRAAAPSGASTGKHEAVAFPKGGVDAAIALFEKDLQKELVGRDSADQEEIDHLLRETDGTTNFSKIGGSIATATSLAVAKAAAASHGLPLYAYLGGRLATSIPRPLGNIIGGGRHAIGGTDIQEFLSIALGPDVKQSIFANAAVHKLTKETLTKRLPGQPLGKGDEGAWVAALPNEEALHILAEACEKASSQFAFPIRPSLDMAASEFFREGRYRYREGSKSSEEQIDYVERLVREYDLYSVEDPLHEEDFEGYSELTRRVGSRCLIVGDDLFVTNRVRIEKGISMGAANAVLIKPNQIGTLTGTIEAVRLSHSKGYRTVMSHRSGETTDDTISHLGVALGCIAIKTGAVGGERLAKLNELIRIEEELI